MMTMNMMILLIMLLMMMVVAIIIVMVMTAMIMITMLKLQNACTTLYVKLETNPRAFILLLVNKVL